MTVVAPMFEIKVALIGYVSVGKTTVLNALLCDKYGEVAMRRTTAGVNYFRISCDPKTKGEDSEAWSTMTDSIQNASSTLDEITADNAKLRECEVVQEKIFDIALDRPLVEMREDTKLVIVDVPGIDEARTGRKYKTWVANNWHKFDCVIVVMDAKQGVNTDAQVELLQFVRNCHENEKKIPLIILGNKFDEPKDEEQLLLVSEFRKEVERIFDVSCRQRALCDLLREVGKNDVTFMDGGDTFPVVIPTSAIHAFTYVAGSRLSFERFKLFDKDLIERLGREQVGKRKWNRLSLDQKYEAAYEVLKNPSDCIDGIRESNFDKVHSVLAHCMGGKDVQTRLIEHQVKTFQQRLSDGGKNPIESLRNLLSILKALKKDTTTLIDTFKIAHSKILEYAIECFRDDPKHVVGIAVPLHQLFSFHKLAGDAEWEDKDAIVSTMVKQIIAKQLEVVFQYRDNEDEVPDRWKELNRFDWEYLLESLRLSFFVGRFCVDFQEEKIHIESLLKAVNLELTSSEEEKWMCYGCLKVLTADERMCLDCNVRIQEGKCPSCRVYCGDDYLKCAHCGKQTVEEFSCHEARKRVYKDGVFVAKQPELRKLILQLPSATSLQDPKHFGHVAWKACRFLDTIALIQ